MEYITLNVQVLTPAFVAGADQECVELRAASVRGQLRWWWRALQQGDVDVMRRREAGIFGLAEQRLRSPVQVSLVGPHPMKIVPKGHPELQSGRVYRFTRNRQPRTGEILSYLAFGPVFNSTLLRPALAPGMRFRVRLAWRHEALDAASAEQLVRAAASWVTLGGLGCRARKGFGALEASVGDCSPSPGRERVLVWWKRQLADVLRCGGRLSCPSQVPDWPQLRYRHVHVLREVHPTWQEALAHVGCLYQFRRSRLGPDEVWALGYALRRKRRASSVLLSVIRKQGGFAGVMVLLPCARSDKNRDSETMVALAKDFSSWYRPGTPRRGP